MEHVEEAVLVFFEVGRSTTAKLMWQAEVERAVVVVRLGGQLEQMLVLDQVLAVFLGISL